MTFTRVRADHPDAATLIAAYFEELRARIGEFDPAKSVSASPDEMAGAQGSFVVGYENAQPVACGGVKRIGKGVAEIKRMFVAKNARGRGLGKALLAELEAIAREMRCTRIMLDTAEPLAEAQRLYLKSGYREIPAYNDNPYAARWFEKDL